MDVTDDDYEIMPHKEIADLKKELEQLKKGPTPEAQNQMEKLTGSINNLLNLFKEAASQMHLEEKEADLVSEKLIPIEQKLDEILEQNQKIAEGILALADLIKEKRSEQERPMMQQPMQPSFGMPPYPKAGNLPPLPPLSRR